MKLHNIHIAALQETKLTNKSKLKQTPGYTIVRKDRGNNAKGGGLIFLIHESIPFQQIPTPPSLKNDPHLEELSIQINSNNNSLALRNIYIPPTSSCTQGYSPPLLSLHDNLPDTSLLLGDFNAHHPLWFSNDIEDLRGSSIVDWLGNTSHLGIANEDTATRSTNNSNTAPDITLATTNLLPTCSWTTDFALSSDHLPILISIRSNIQKTRAANKTFINFQKANWDAFTEFTESNFSNYTFKNDVHKDEKFFRTTLNKATKLFIPSGRIPTINNEMPSNTVTLINERNNLRATDPTNDRINILNREIDLSIRNHRRDKWIQHLDNCPTGSKKLWDTIKGLNGQTSKNPNQSIKFNNIHQREPKKIANKFNEQYTPSAITKPTKEFRSILRHIQDKKPADPTFKISPQEVLEAIKTSKNSKAIGPDGISPLMIKHLGQHGITFLTTLFENCINQSIIPPLWKVGRIIPLPKPGKPSDEGPSYRPISLLSPAAKLLEKIILPTLQNAITLKDHQHGFRKNRSTLTALQDITDHIKQGLNKKKPVDRTILVAIDLSRAFDTVNHEILIKDIYKLNLNDHIKRFLVAYLRGRQTYVEFRGSKSKFRKMHQGVPQGGVLSPTLFNLYMTNMPPPPDKTKLVTYADDSSVLLSGPKIDPLCKILNEYLTDLKQWFLHRNLQISAPKSSATLFTTFSNEMSLDLPIYIDGDKIPTVNHPKILGVTLDPQLNFNTHAKLLKNKINSKNNMLKALAGSSWGKDKKTLQITYKATGQSLLNYCAPIWTPTLSETNWKELQTSQNQALRTITGCVKMSNIDHLHSETKSMPVKDHCNMLSKQFLLATQKPNHPNHCALDENVPRLMKNSLTTKFGPYIQTMTNNQPIETQTYKILLKNIHTEAVTDTINNQSPNPVLDLPAPDINEEEKTLPRRTRTTLSQLRSGYSPFLQTYLNRINPNTYPNPNCPICNIHLHTTNHIFNCPNNPTDLTTDSLWTSPVQAAEFIGLELREGVG